MGEVRMLQQRGIVPRYQWQNYTIIQQVDLSDNLSYRFAYLYPRADLDRTQMDALPDILQKHGLVAFKDVRDGQPVLRVRGFDKASSLFAIMQQEGLVENGFTHKEALQEEVDPKARSWKKYIRKHSIELAGAFYIAADLMPLASGLTQRDKNPGEIAQGVAWLTTSLVLLLCGRKNADVQLGNMYTKMKEYLYNEGVDLPEDEALALEQLQRKPNYWNKLINFFYEHPVLFNNTLQGVGGVMQSVGGLNKGSIAGLDRSNPFKTAAGAFVTTGQWAGMLIPENKYASLPPEQKAEYTKNYLRGEGWANGFNASFTDPVNWAKEKPLRLSGLLPGINNVLSGIGALLYDRKEIHEWFGVSEGWWGGLKDKFIYKGDSLKNLKKEDLQNRNSRYARLLTLRGRYNSDMPVGTGITKEYREWENLEAQFNAQLDRNRARQFIAVSPVFNLIANSLYGMSSKEDRSDLNTEDTYLDEIITLGANIYGALPEESRMRKITKFAGFIAHQPDIVPTQQQIAQRVVDKITEIEQTWGANTTPDKKPANSLHHTRDIIGGMLADAGIEYTPSNKVAAQDSEVELAQKQPEAARA